jgi:DNA-binding NtrC family response regulator
LRERPGDIALLARHFAAALGHRRPDCAEKTIADGPLHKLEAYHWPGNVRELANVVQRAVVMSASESIACEHIVLGEPNAQTEPPAASATTFRGARAETVAAFERAYVADLLRRHCGNVTHAAREADKDRRAFGRLVKKYGIDRLNP